LSDQFVVQLDIEVMRAVLMLSVEVRFGLGDRANIRGTSFGGGFGEVCILEVRILARRSAWW